ncbi:MAG: hypothetical protein HY362_03405 [Candidatus Aenigmarchaeota archaeon]|nr:hypothetical protein [Candidatus Aenigmarchaeota archaeon]
MEKGLRHSLGTAAGSNIRVVLGWKTIFDTNVSYGLFDLSRYGVHGTAYVLRAVLIGDGRYEIGKVETYLTDKGPVVRNIERTIPFGARNAVAAPLVSICNGAAMVYLPDADQFDGNGKPRNPILYNAPTLSHMPPGGIAVFENPEKRKLSDFFDGPHCLDPSNLSGPRIMTVKTEELERLPEIKPMGDVTLFRAFQEAVVF